MDFGTKKVEIMIIVHPEALHPNILLFLSGHLSGGWGRRTVSDGVENGGNPDHLLQQKKQEVKMRE